MSKFSNDDGGLGCLGVFVLSLLAWAYGLDTVLLAALGILAGAASIVRLWSFPRPTASVREKVRFVLSIYIALIVVYGGLYFFAFKFTPGAFSFAAQPIEERNEKAFQGLRGALESLNDQLVALEVLQAEGMRNPTTPLAKSASLASLPDIRHATEVHGIRVRCEHLIAIVNGRRYDLGHSGALLAGETGQRMKGILHASTPGERFQAIEAAKVHLWAVREVILKRVARLKPEDPEWNVFDFVYFSFITMATIGYGDIAPSSTLTRCLVMSEGLAGIFLLGFSLVTLWPQK